MAELATQLIRTTVRTFYTVDQILVIDALVIHSTLSDTDLAAVLNMLPKTLRKHCGRLKEDGLLSIHTRAERRIDQAPSFHGNNPQTGKERLTNRDWYYLNYHRAIDSIKYRMHKLNKHIDSLGMPTTEKKDLSCPRCKSQYTELEVLDNLDESTGQFLCHRCRNPLDAIEEEERANENESMKRLNQQFEKLQQLLQSIDAAAVPENDFETALGKQKPIPRTDANPGARTEIVDVKNKNLESTKGLELKPEKIAVQVQDDEDVKRENAAAEAEARKAKEARANALPEWISRSTITQEITAVGAKEEKERREREAHSGVVKDDDGDEKKPSVDNDDVMAAYWKELAAAREKEAQEARDEEEEDDDDEEDEFEDVDVNGSGTPANGANGTAATSTGMNTPLNVESSNATDDEREAKRARLDEPSSSNLANGANGQAEKAAEDTPAASDADDDELEFQDV
ncbi:hypothetical protein M409DRAFT_63317 [Zasmidium cellare ATCC 36951]|uniref:HTH TFE/IIEalpha-type domain-containing protein n=1 Tax=Zasmidium cellare ATCC 36951 TaxID=1080233 RepID=A0A6A6CYA8_ZASCE|nr:uncharacterized protein M409DRAFT_63317 [Zasmidium cellare ATCC 36951]KAF2171703.1 hypothetical protein M409DRAFT_63317 [Zasmidium cellare ATCC 36951]